MRREIADVAEGDDSLDAGAEEVLKKPLLARELAQSLARIFAAPVAVRV